MKLSKRLLALALAFLLVFGNMTVAFAAGEETVPVQEQSDSELSEQQEQEQEQEPAPEPPAPEPVQQPASEPGQSALSEEPRSEQPDSGAESGQDDGAEGGQTGDAGDAEDAGDGKDASDEEMDKDASDLDIAENTADGAEEPAGGDKEEPADAADMELPAGDGEPVEDEPSEGEPMPIDLPMAVDSENMGTVELKVGQEMSLSESGYIIDGVYIFGYSSNDKVASVEYFSDRATVKGQGIGKATIRLWAATGLFQFTEYSLTVIVYDDFQVSYNADGGTDIPAGNTYKNGASVTVGGAPTPPAGKRFVGWRMGDGTPYKPGETFTMPEHDVGFTAVYEDEVYTVQYTDGVEDRVIFGDETYSARYGEDTPVFKGTAEREGYDFAGWKPEVEKTVTGNTAYTAQWRVQQYAYTVKFYDTDGLEEIAKPETGTGDFGSQIPVPEEGSWREFGGKSYLVKSVQGHEITAEPEKNVAQVYLVLDEDQDGKADASQATVLYEAAAGGSVNEPSPGRIDLTDEIKELKEMPFTANVTAVPETGYAFDHWDMNGEPIEGGAALHHTFTAEGGGTYIFTAHFAKDDNGDGIPDHKQSIKVSVQGASKEVFYNGEEQVVDGYTVQITTPDGETVSEYPGVTVTVADGAARAAGTVPDYYPTSLADEGNVTITSEYDVDITILPGHLRIKPAQSKDYNAAVSLEGWTYGDEPNSPDASVTGENPVLVYPTEEVQYRYYDAGGIPLPGVPTDAGAYSVQAFWPASDRREMLSSEKVPFTIAPKRITVYGRTELEYNGEEQSAKPLPSGSNGSNAFLKKMGHKLQASIKGTEVGIYYDIEWSVADSDGNDVSKNYTLGVEGHAYLNIKQAKAASYEASVVMEGWTYGDEPHVPAGTVTGKNASLVYADPTEYTYFTADGTPLEDVPTDAGSYTVKASWGETASREAHSAVGSFTIAPKPITVTADDVTVTYGETVPELTYTVPDGALVAGDDADVLNVTLTRPAGGNAAEYAITGTGSADNYDVTVKAGTLTIEPRTITVSTDSATKTYDGTPLTAAGHVEGLADGETVTVTTSSRTAVGSSANDYTLVWNGTAREGNYTVVEGTIGTLTVTAAPAAPAGPAAAAPGGGAGGAGAGGGAPVAPAAAGPVDPLAAGPAGADAGLADIGVDDVPLANAPAADVDDGERSVSLEDAGDTIIDEGETPLAGLVEQDCCILHFILMLCALGVTVLYTHDRKKRQAREFELRSELRQ